MTLTIDLSKWPLASCYTVHIYTHKNKNFQHMYATLSAPPALSSHWPCSTLHYSLLKCFGQQTNSTPENNEIPQGNNMAKLRICIPRSWQAAAPVWFHLTNGQQRDALWMWSKRQPSGTSSASDWNGPSESKCTHTMSKKMVENGRRNKQRGMHESKQAKKDREK